MNLQYSYLLVVKRKSLWQSVLLKKNLLVLWNFDLIHPTVHFTALVTLREQNLVGKCSNQLTPSDQACSCQLEESKQLKYDNKDIIHYSFTFSLLVMLFELNSILTASSFQTFQTITSPHRWHSNGKLKQTLCYVCV